MREISQRSARAPEIPLEREITHLRENSYLYPIWSSRHSLPSGLHGTVWWVLQSLVDDEVAKAISRIIALALNLEVDFFDRQEMLGKPITTLRLLHYEGRVSDPMKGIYGAGAHSDFGLITLLATDDVYGLQICKDKDAKPQKWEFVAPLKGAFIVNLGGMLERWSNCIFRLHTLWSPVMIVLLNACPPASRKRTLPTASIMFPPIKCETYMLQRYKETHAILESYKK
ncbi:hypothetical protein HYC85_026298 [Camellia sinensis]|uniref:Isopenicillin N synthase-like Fe(2+) 2OG dioxygenase domain-containing protein n=1 Tax=Camellia sinensis TaxID=4442 RepID=A0A7J7G393_CAMSI|nr:hypothetical protein HYC85_026298 [Camellia sinensis]